MKDQTLPEIQASTMWGAHGYGKHFEAETTPWRDTRHAAQHVSMHGGDLLRCIDQLEHTDESTRAEAEKRVADVFICLVRVANTWPGGAIDIQAAVRARLAGKGLDPTAPAPPSGT